MTATATTPTSTVPSEAPARGRWGFAHLPALDGLRGIAVLAVLVYHGEHLPGGYLGVDLFFALSGFLITSLLLAEHGATGRISLKGFWARRARRLLPAVILLVIGVSIYARFMARAVDLDSIRTDGLATLAYVANWHTILHGQSYWDISLAPSPFQHTWSLAIEEQFYLLWPLIVLALAKWRPKRLDQSVGILAGVGAVLAAGWFVTLYALGASETRLYQGTDTRAAALLGGAALAAWCRLRPTDPARPDRQRVLGVVATVAAVVLGILWFRLEGTSPWLYRGGLPFASGLALLLVAAVARRAPGPITPVLSIAPLRWFGAISYGLYLWHWPIFLIVDQRNGELPFLGDRVLTDPLLFAVKFGLSVLAAVISYRLVEQPIRHGALTPRIAGPAAIASLAVAGVLIVAATAGGLTVSGQDEPIAKEPTVKVVGAPDVLFVGDSVAQAVVQQVIKDPKAFGINPINRTYPGCSPVAQGRPSRNFAGGATEPPPCFRDLDAELPEMKPDGVFLLVGVRPNDQVQVDGEWVGACDPAFDRAYRESMEELVKRLQGTGAPVAIGTVAHSSDNVAIKVEDSEERIDCVNAQIEQLVEETPGTSLIDANAIVCPDGAGNCIEEIDGDQVRPDGIHYGDGPAGKVVSKDLVAEALAGSKLEPATGTPGD